MALRFKIFGRIARPVSDVFRSVTEPRSLSSYFTTGGASAPLREGTTVTWQFADFPGVIPVKVTRVVPDERIELSWEAAERGYDTQVVMTFEAVDASTTLVRIAESGWRDSEEGRKSSYDNCSGWMQMLCCLKAWAEHGINLRQGFFE
jgi:uncharacterized protein YndB with AHSA1/START domain